MYPPDNAAPARRRTVVVAAAASLILSGVFSYIAHTSRASAAPPPTKTPAPEVSWVIRHAGVDAATAAARLALQDRVPEVNAVVTKQLGANFGGIWSDISTGTITVATTGRPVDFSSFDGDTQLAGRLKQLTVRHSLADLEALNAKLFLLARHTDGVTIAGVSLQSNSVLVHLSAGTVLAALPADLASAIASARTALSIDTLATPAAVHARSCSNGQGDWGAIDCNPPLRGGISIDPGPGSWGWGPCTAGFVARSKSDAKPYVVTAGHCDSTTPTSDAWWAYFANLDAHKVGNTWRRTFASSGDYASIAVANPTGWSPGSYVVVIAGSDTTRDELYPITGAVGSSVGDVVCTTLSMSSATYCGIVTRLGVSVYYNGVTVQNLGVVHPDTNYECGVNGDSGGPVYRGGKARGIYEADYRTSGNACVEWYYQGISAALSALNLTIP